MSEAEQHVITTFDMASRIVDAGAFNLSQTFDDITKSTAIQRTQTHLERLLASLNLPVPDQDDQVFAAKEGNILLLENYGVVVRMESDTAAVDPQVDACPFILPTLGKIRQDGVITEICPGVIVPASEKDTFWLADQLKRHGLLLDEHELDVRNCGYLPVSTPEFPNGLPVVIDRSSVVPDPDAQNIDITDDPVALLYEQTLQTLYGDLQDSFSESLHSGAEIDHGSIVLFWEECEQSHESGNLVSGWAAKGEHHPVHQSEAQKASHAYQQKLASHNPTEYRFDKAPRTFKAT